MFVDDRETWLTHIVAEHRSCICLFIWIQLIILDFNFYLFSDYRNLAVNILVTYCPASILIVKFFGMLKGY